jgi:hypothetical protein
MEAFKYRWLLWELIAATDTGKYDALEFEEVHRHASAGSIQAFLRDHFDEEDITWSFLEPQDWSDLAKEWADLANAIDAQRKFGVENKGVCLLMVYTLEGLQRQLKVEKQEA